MKNKSKNSCILFIPTTCPKTVFCFSSALSFWVKRRICKHKVKSLRFFTPFRMIK